MTSSAAPHSPQELGSYWAHLVSNYRRGDYKDSLSMRWIEHSIGCLTPILKKSKNGRLAHTVVKDAKLTTFTGYLGLIVMHERGLALLGEDRRWKLSAPQAISRSSPKRSSGRRRK